jgi:uncharacterized membrane protein YeiH
VICSSAPFRPIAFATGDMVRLHSPVEASSFSLFHLVPTHLMITLDAAGLALFAVAGAGKALEYGITPLLAILMGAVTGAGGGTVRDVLLAQVPGVLHSDVYASAALAGAAVVAVGMKLKMPRGLAMTLGAAFCFVLRMVAVWRHWNLPKVMMH